MNLRSLVSWLTGLGPAAQASIPGLYAWAVTVATCGWSKGVPWQTRALVLLGPMALAASIFIDRDRPAIARHVSVWGLGTSSLLVWALVPASVGPGHFDAVRGVMGMLGWGTFAFASAAPAFQRRPEDDARVIERGRLPPRGRGAGRHAPVLGVGLVIAAALQLIGWGIEPRERALLVRLYTLLAGMSVLAVFAEVSLAAHAPRGKRRVPRGIFAWAAACLLLGGVALGFELSG